MQGLSWVWRWPCRSRRTQRVRGYRQCRPRRRDDISGIFQDTNGMGSVEAARMAAEDFNGGGKGIKVEIVYADHQNKADVVFRDRPQMARCRRLSMPWWTCRIPAVGLTINSLLRDSRMTFLASSTASSDLTGKACSPNTIQWVNDAWATGNSTRGGDDGARRQGMVFYHGQLRARPGHRGRGHQLHRKARRQGAGLGQASAQHAGFCFASAAGAEFQGQGDRARQCRRRHRQRGEAGGRVRSSGKAARPWWRSCCSSTTSTAWG